MTTPQFREVATQLAFTLQDSQDAHRRLQQAWKRYPDMAQSHVQDCLQNPSPLIQLAIGRFLLPPFGLLPPDSYPHVLHPLQ